MTIPRIIHQTWKDDNLPIDFQLMSPVEREYNEYKEFAEKLMKRIG